MKGYDPRSASEITLLEETYRASEIASTLNAEIIGSDILIEGVSTFSANVENSLSYQCIRPQNDSEIERAVLCSRETAPFILASTKLIVDDPREAFLSLLSRLKPNWKETVARQAERMSVQSGISEIHKTALVEEGTVIGQGVIVEPYAVIGRGVIIGEHTLVSSGSIIGTHGPALYKTLTGKNLSLVQLHFGTVQIENDVEIGAHSVILRGMLGRTHIGRNTVLGNIVHIGHGCEIRERVWMAARVTVCGHVFIDSDVSIGAGATIRDNVKIYSNASIGMGSLVVGDVDADKHVLGVPAKEKVGHSSKKSGPSR